MAPIAFLVALIASCWLYWWGSTLHPGMMPGRSAGVLLVVGSLLAAHAARRGGMPHWPSAGRTGWRRLTDIPPWTWCAAALLWQLAVWAWAAPVREPGALWMTERAAALATALGIAIAYAGRLADRQVGILAACAAGVLCLAALARVPVDGAALGLRCRIGVDAPFGVGNFNVGGALPLLGAGLALVIRGAAWRHRLIVIAGSVAALIVGLGWWTETGSRSVFAGSGVMALFLLILRLPRSFHGIGVGLLAGLLVVGVAAAMAAPEQVAGSTPSTLQRVHLWHAALQAGGASLLWGHGPGASIAVIPAQGSFACAWLAVPSYAEHVHNEYLQALLDGGVVLVVLLGAALRATLRPLWTRRDDPFCAALLTAWAGVLALALIDPHLSQPGPLLLLAMLAGASWAVVAAPASASGKKMMMEQTRTGLPHPSRAVLATVSALIATIAAVQVVREFGDGGSPPMIERRSDVIGRADAGDWPGVRAAAARLRQRLGPLDWLPGMQAIAEARLARTRDDNRRAGDFAREQARLLPVDVDNLSLLDRLRQQADKQGDADEARRLSAALDAGVARCRQVLDEVPRRAVKDAERWDRAARFVAGYGR